VDARLHCLQTEAERVKPAELLSVLKDFHREKLTLRQRHVAVARHVANYSFNNTYQYVIAREDMHLAWLESAIQELEGTPDQVGEPSIAAPGKKGKPKDAFLPLVQEDTREAEAFVTRWRARAGEVTNARHRNLLHVILGETTEHKRFFDLMLAGRDDLLGRRMDGAGTGDGVIGTRWLE
jgi:hypothetical protein